MVLSSPDNPRVKQLKALASAKGRSKHRLFLIEGPHLVEDALAASAQVAYCLLADGWDGKWAMAGRAAERQAPCYFATERVMREVSTTETPPQAVAAIALPQEDREPQLDPGQRTLGVILYGVQDPGNVGTTVRTAAAAGADVVAAAGACADFYGPKVVRSSAGALFRVQLVETAEPKRLIRDSVSSGYRVFAALPRGGRPHREPDYRSPALFLLGSEAYGLPPELVAACTHKVSIAMESGVESLNVAVSAGILLFEARAQRLKDTHVRAPRKR